MATRNGKPCSEGDAESPPRGFNGPLCRRVDGARRRAHLSFRRATTAWAWGWAWGEGTLDRKRRSLMNYRRRC